ncbi:MAG: multidrug transporter EmrE-like cation transporter [Bradyrhizobium sp.]|jgi:multidrug transporter EmrE-like cation transporter
MNAIRMLGVALIIAGVLGLAYGGFSYTKETQAVKIGPLELNVKEKKDVNIPMWAGIAAIVAGGLMLAAGGKKG